MTEATSPSVSYSSPDPTHEKSFYEFSRELMLAHGQDMFEHGKIAGVWSGLGIAIGVLDTECDKATTELPTLHRIRTLLRDIQFEEIISHKEAEA